MATTSSSGEQLPPPPPPPPQRHVFKAPPLTSLHPRRATPLLTHIVHTIPADDHIHQVQHSEMVQGDIDHDLTAVEHGEFYTMNFLEAHIFC